MGQGVRGLRDQKLYFQRTRNQSVEATVMVEGPIVAAVGAEATVAGASIPLVVAAAPALELELVAGASTLVADGHTPPGPA